MMHCINVLKIQLVWFFVYIVQNETNPVIAVGNDFAHHEIRITLKHFLELGLCLSWQRCHNFRWAVYNEECIISFWEPIGIYIFSQFNIFEDVLQILVIGIRPIVFKLHELRVSSSKKIV